jgi:hypothetical protein
MIRLVDQTGSCVKLRGQSSPHGGLTVGVRVQSHEVHLELDELLKVHLVIVFVPLVRAFTEVVEWLDSADGNLVRSFVCVCVCVCGGGGG